LLKHVLGLQAEVHSSCSHQCRTCGVMYECMSNNCDRAFQYGKCDLCNELFWNQK